MSLSLRKNERSSSAVEIIPPKCLGNFSVDGYAGLCAVNNENMKFLVNNFRTNTNVYLDLNKGHDRIIKKDMGAFFKERKELTYICKWILLHKSSLYTMVDKRSCFTSRIFPDFVLRRGTIKDILLAASSVDIEWNFNVVRYRGTIYIAGVRKHQEGPDYYSTGAANKFSNYGSKFEQLMAGESGPLDERKDYYRVVDTSLGKHRLLLYGEVDGIDNQIYRLDRKTMDACMELKTTAMQDSMWEKEKFIKYKKPLLWWAQSAVFGISEIVCGFRDLNGIVRKTEVVKVKDLPTYKSSSRVTFDKNDLLKFAVRFFDWLNDLVDEDTPTVYGITCSTNSHLITSRIVYEPSFISISYMNSLFPY